MPRSVRLKKYKYKKRALPAFYIRNLILSLKYTMVTKDDYGFRHNET